MRILRRISGLLLAGSVLFTSATAQAKESWYDTDSEYHAGVSFSDMKYEAIDKDDYEAVVKQLTEDIKKSDNEVAVLEDFDKIISYQDYFETDYSLNSINYYSDPTNEEASENDQELSEYDTYWTDLAYCAISEACKSDYADALKEHIDNEEIFEMFLGYEPVTEEESALLKEENELVQQYDELSVGDYDSYEEENALECPIYVKLVENRNKQAKLAGYDNYAEYAYEQLYGRDYSLDDAAAFYEYVKEYIVPVYDNLCDSYEYENGLSDYAPTQSEQLALVKPYLSEIDEELEEAFDYMSDYGLCDLSDSDTKLDTGYTDMFYYYGEPFIFNAPEEDWYRVETLVHEFGHYNASFHNDRHYYQSDSNMDVAEIDSQGLEVLFLDFADEMYGEDNAADVRMTVLINLLASVVTGCLYDEFQTAVFSYDGTLDVDTVNSLFASISADYGEEYTSSDDSKYSWVYVTHTFESPMYYVSYATSAFTALDILAMSIDDYDKACDKYMEITTYGTSTGYCELIKAVGLSDAFSEADVKTLASSIEDYVNTTINNQQQEVKSMAIENILLLIIIILLVIMIVYVIRFREKRRKKFKEN